MAVTGFLFGNLPLKAFNAEINFTSGTIKGMLLTNAASPNQDTWIYKSSVTNEITGTGYTAGGATLGSKGTSYTGASNLSTFTGANLVWGSSTLTARYLVLYLDTGNAATSVLIGYLDFGADVSSTNANFTIAWNASGIFTVTVS